MPHKPRRESSTRFYHIYVRGINKEKIFGQPREKNYFKRIIRKYLKEYDVEIYSYCIMSNHAHLLIKSDLKELSMFMSKVLAKYCYTYNPLSLTPCRLSQDSYVYILNNSKNTRNIIIIKIIEMVMYFKTALEVNVLT